MQSFSAQTLHSSPDPAVDSPWELDESFFDHLDRYVPLSNLPTPPLSDPSTPESLPEVDLEDLLNPDLFGPASYLASMIPKNATREASSAYVIQSILQRANLSMETIALGSCILDCLSSRFLRRWRMECCADEGSLERCEILAVAALSIALKFLEDKSFCSKRWAKDLSGGRFSTRSLNTTERLILDDINYTVARICTPELIQFSLDEIKRLTESLSPENSLPYSILEKDESAFGKLAQTHFPRLPAHADCKDASSSSSSPAVPLNNLGALHREFQPLPGSPP